MWDELARGALGAVVLADTRRLADCFPSVDYFERRAIPFVVAVNCFEGARRYRSKDVRSALDLDPDVPVMPVRRAAPDVRPGRAGQPGRARAGDDVGPPVRPGGARPLAGRNPSAGRKPECWPQTQWRPPPAVG